MLMYNAIAVSFTDTKSAFARSDHKTGNRNKKNWKLLLMGRKLPDIPHFAL